MAHDTILEEILAAKREEVARLQLFRSAIRGQADEAPPPRGFEASLRRPGEVSVVAEFKRRSPSAGDINPYAQAAGVASVYASAGAAAISVLTDERYFGGSLDDLRSAKDAVGVPVLRKDFTLDPVQLYEARAAGADAVLLIVRALGDARLRELLEIAGELGLGALVEAHDEEEVARALEAGARILGVNARDLATFEVDLERSLRLIEELPADVAAVAESGIRSAEDAAAAGSAGADAVLVGGWLMAGDPAAGVEALVGHPQRPRSGRMQPAGADAAGDSDGAP
ncbi:MAG: indole-3-glycerol phosphate synthase TrpC [Gemmatimonadota bacterium]|uniref:indole-3-glycerol phosphate synthase TrpC n=1 Tax=Candidatus Palauibacter scopulicola TaxID=3056741 RepID=UPI002397DD49|nr:indole-3-glycerol phosphate synthase TrpC [Candidatus Palauibacter scopulicola]MDE2663406.1 indole-3-glycerol phosphate synthase TrpC [Candidatus Palauibacter scopulicola]